MQQQIFDSMKIMRFSKRKVATEELCGGKKPTNIWDVNGDNIVISK